MLGKANKQLDKWAGELNFQIIIKNCYNPFYCMMQLNGAYQKKTIKLT